MSTHFIIDFWINDTTGRARSGELAQAIESSFGSEGQTDALAVAIGMLGQGNIYSLPKISILSQAQLKGHLGAYSPEIDTIFISHEALQHPFIALEVLTHELGHSIANRYYGGAASPEAAYQFTQSLMGQDHALVLSSGARHEHTADSAGHSDLVVLPGTTTPLALQWFDTSLHIDWARAQLPMLNSQAFDLLKLGQNDSDAFVGVARVGIFSPYGLQTDSSTHFDNNNVRGSLESMRKRWSNGIERFDDTDIDRKINLPFVDKALVGPSFDGANAGVENLLYRFGQITHAMQDFYSHSNWIELVRGTRNQWIAADTILDSSLDLPAQLNPGSYLNNAPDVMVAMSGPDYDATLALAGVGQYATGSKSVYWWVNDRQDGWGETFANPLSGGEIGGLMTGAVNSAVYYDTNYSVPLRAVDRAGFLDKKYYRGFSHGGLAGEVIGQWMSPLSKDKADNGRFADKSANRVLFEDAQAYAALQVRHDFDRMSNLIFKNHGVEGLQKFADFSIVQSERDLFVSTYSRPNTRWDWDAANSAFAPVMALMSVFEDDGHEHAEDFHFDEANMRFIEVFYAGNDHNFVTLNNRSYLTQVIIDGQWFDAAQGLINTHHDHKHDYGPEAFLPASVQHAEIGGRMVYSHPNHGEGHYLGTIYSVANINLEARIFINHFDVGLDEVHVVDAQGVLIEAVDIDRADYAQTRQYLLDTHNIKLNARPETQVLSHALVIRSQDTIGAVILKASDFFASPGALHAANHDPSAGLHTDLKFAGHDQTRPWLAMLDDGTLQISDISLAPQGIHEIYVSVHDEAGLLEGAMITLAIDPQVIVGTLAYDPMSQIELSFRNPTESAIGIFGQVMNDQGLPVSFVEHFGVRIGDASGVPAGLDASAISTNLADSIDHGTMQFFVHHYGTRQTVALEIKQTGQDQYVLSQGDEILADLSIKANTGTSPTYIDEIYVNGLEDVLLGIPLNISFVDVVSNSPNKAHKISIEATAASESFYRGEFGFFVADLQSGFLIDPDSGVKHEDVGLSPSNIRDYSVFSIANITEAASRVTASFLLNADLNLNNLALFPYYQVDTHQGNQLFISGAGAMRDGVSHVVRVANNTFGVEDLVAGDYDFDDVVVTLNSIIVSDFV